MRKAKYLQFVPVLTVFMLAGGTAFGQTASPPAQGFQFGNRTLQPGSITANTISTSAGCEADKVADPLSTVFERADAARRYERCMMATFAQARAVQSRSNNMVGAIALQNLDSTVMADVRLQAEAAQAGANFMGLSWGLGFGYSIGGDDIIESAEIVNGVVRATDDRTDQARVLLEFHRFFWCNNKNRSVESGCGPFVALAASSDDILKGVGVGFMWGWKSKDPSASEGFSVGIGAILDNDVKSLADGFSENAPPPPGETVVRFKKEARWSGLLFVTRTF